MNARPLLAEFIGTFTLVFAGIGSIAVGAGLVGVALAHGLAIAVMVTATAATSGGHLNPAVTFGAWIARRITPARALQYMIAQCLGALVGAWLISLAIPGQASTLLKAGTPTLGNGVSTGEALLMETVLTFFLVFVVFETAIDNRAPKVGGLFIGLTVTLDILCGGPITGAAMNPARHLGPAVLAGEFSNIWLYWLAPLAGGALAGVVGGFVFDQK